jgi:hypothetical protein
MAEENVPATPFDDSAVMAALGKHWVNQTRHLHMAAQPGSYSVQGIDIVSPPPAPDPRDLFPTLVVKTLIVPEGKDDRQQRMPQCMDRGDQADTIITPLSACNYREC